MALKRMDNVGIVVDDLGATIDFFRELGLELEGRATIEGEWAGRVTGLSDQRVEIAMLRTHTRAIIFPKCATGYQNPDTGSCVSPSGVHWVEGNGFPNASTVGRNTLRTGGTNNFDLNLTKVIPLGEKRRFELRLEALNAFNHPQFIQVPHMSVFVTQPGQFLNRDFTDSGIRAMWVQAKVVF